MVSISGFTARASGELRVNNEDNLNVHIDRRVHFDREPTGTWGVHVYRTDPDAEAQMANGEYGEVAGSVRIDDPAVFAFLDRFMELLADPTDKHASCVLPRPTPRENAA